MKKLLLLIPCLLVSLALISQSTRARTAKSVKATKALPAGVILSSSSAAAAMDTLLPGAFADTCSNTVTVFTINNGWGFVAGTNNFLDREKAQRFDFTGSAQYTVSEVWGFFNAATVVGDGDVAIKIYSVDENTGGPGDLLGTSSPRPVSELQLDSQFVVRTAFIFLDPPAVSQNQFFASLDLAALYNSQDTVGVFITSDGCGDGNDSWELFSNSITWLPISDADQSWNLNANFFIFAIVEFATAGTDEAFVIQKGLTLYPAYPNPAQDLLNIKFALQESAPVTIEIYSTDGRRIREVKIGDKAAGEHTHTVDLIGLSAGSYVHGVVTDQARIMSRFAIGK